MLNPKLAYLYHKEMIYLNNVVDNSLTKKKQKQKTPHLI